MSNFRVGDKWKEWTIENLIGIGSFGEVYKISKREFNHVYDAALKVIHIPQSKAEIRQAYSEGMDEKSVTNYFQSMVEDIINECDLMSALKGNSNIVSYEDHQVVAAEDGIGWDIFIRMELLTPLIEIQSSKSFLRKDLIKIGIDICKALELCSKFNIIHRDIKPENIFYSNQGSYKLGDFGIARKLENASYAMSKKGTGSYMAPEVFQNMPYDERVDIYSLGLVLYRLLNDYRAPFLPPYPEQIKFSDRNTAEEKRLSGVRLPLPCNSLDRLGEIVLKACEYDRADRYRTATEFRVALENELIAEEKSGKALDVINRVSLEKSYTQKLASEADLYERTVLMFDDDRRRAEAEARFKAEEEARLKAEEELKRRIEEDKRRKAEEELRRKAEEEARLKAEEEAKRKAEEELRRKYEEAKRQAEEAKRQAEEVARRKTEEKARRKAQKKREQDQGKRSVLSKKTLLIIVAILVIALLALIITKAIMRTRSADTEVIPDNTETTTEQEIDIPSEESKEEAEGTEEDNEVNQQTPKYDEGIYYQMDKESYLDDHLFVYSTVTKEIKFLSDYDSISDLIVKSDNKDMVSDFKAFYEKYVSSENDSGYFRIDVDAKKDIKTLAEKYGNKENWKEFLFYRVDSYNKKVPPVKYIKIKNYIDISYYDELFTAVNKEIGFIPYWESISDMIENSDSQYVAIFADFYNKYIDNENLEGYIPVTDEVLDDIKSLTYAANGSENDWKTFLLYRQDYQTSRITSSGDQSAIVIDETDANIRKGPGSEYEKVGKVPYKSEVKVLSFEYATDGYAWYEIEYDGITGYVRGNLIYVY